MQGLGYKVRSVPIFTLYYMVEQSCCKSAITVLTNRKTNSWFIILLPNVVYEASVAASGVDEEELLLLEQDHCVRAREHLAVEVSVTRISLWRRKREGRRGA
jgi:hypothetical protein